MFVFIWPKNIQKAVDAPSLNCIQQNVKQFDYILEASVINARKRRNAISLIGLFATWLLEIFYAVIGGFLATFIKDGNLLREIVELIIPFGFYFVPLVQIYTTPSIKSFLKE